MKPVVTFEGTVGPIEVGNVAFITGIKGHPSQASGDLVGEFARTSRVVRVVSERGTCGEKVFEFETENTIYRKA